MRKALKDDIPTLIEFMSEFYAESGFHLNPVKAERAFSVIIADQRLGFVWLIESAEKDVGYIVVSCRFSMEHGGFIACIDDFFITRPDRNKGLGSAALIQVAAFCKKMGICAVTVEVGLKNNSAKKTYRRIGMIEVPDRQLLTLTLKKPAHDGSGKFDT